MFLIVYYLIVSALAAKCSTAQANCAENMCEMVGTTEVCTQCKEAGNVPIDGTCTAVGEADTKCKKAGGTAVGKDDTKCEKCEGAEIFLFMGGCYDKGKAPGSSICTAVSAGECTTCNTNGNYIFQNPAAKPTPGTKCILCSDATDKNGVTGVANCNKCTYTGTTGPATCSACQDGYYKSGNACTKCADTCATCKTDANTCISCPKGKYLKDTGCVDKEGCTNDHYPDPASGKCISCGAATSEGGIENCATCEYDSAKGKPKCTACLEGKYLDGNTCIDASSCKGAKYPDPKTNKCIQCNAAAEQGGIPECTACTYSDSLQKPVCSACGGSKPLLKTAADGTTTCETNCGEGYFQHTATSSNNLKTCQSCSAPKDGLTPAVTGIPGCTQCTYTENTSTLKCTACGSGFKLEGEACVPAGTNLSTGAIAGISVAAVVVVGGLVGFLCWWFICRGKA